MRVGGIRFNMLMVDFTQKTTEQEVILLKSKGCLSLTGNSLRENRSPTFLSMAPGRADRRSFFAAATNARKIVGIDIRESSEAILGQAAKFGDRLALVYETSQADRVPVNAAIGANFDGPVDLVIDDASHQYELNKAAFEIAFARLRVGGYYVIEDWNWAHYENRHYDEYWRDQEALSNLVLEIVLAVGSIGPIKSVNVFDWGVLIEKGAEVEPNFRLADLIRMGEKRSFKRF